MDMSESIKTLAAALAKAQGEFKAVPKLGYNPFLKNHYVQLDDIIEAIRGPLSKNGIAWVQPLLTGQGDELALETLLLHESGEWMSCVAPIQSQSAKGLSDLQSLGVALSYMRRYMLTTMLGINSGDDEDGNGKDKTTEKKPTAEAAPKAQPAKSFDPLNPDWTLVTSWDHFMDTVAHYVEHYNHAAHVKNALAKIYPDNSAKKGLTYQVAWTALIDHANAPKDEVPA